MLTGNILAYRLSDSVISCPVGVCTLGDIDLLHWFIFASGAVTTSPVKVVWDLSEFYKAIPLPGDVREELSKSPHRARYSNYKFYYVADKVFSVEKNNSIASFYDLSQYFPDEEEPMTLDGLQGLADLLEETLEELGIMRITTLSSPVALFKGAELLNGALSTVPTILDSTTAILEAHEIALQCTPREWVSNYQIGVWGL